MSLPSERHLFSTAGFNNKTEISPQIWTENLCKFLAIMRQTINYNPQLSKLPVRIFEIYSGICLTTLVNQKQLSDWKNIWVLKTNKFQSEGSRRTRGPAMSLNMHFPERQPWWKQAQSLRHSTSKLRKDRQEPESKLKKLWASESTATKSNH